MCVLKAVLFDLFRRSSSFLHKVTLALDLIELQINTDPPTILLEILQIPSTIVFLRLALLSLGKHLLLFSHTLLVLIIVQCYECFLQVDAVLTGKVAKDEVIREASRFLSQFDALSSQFEYGVADIVAKSVLIGSCDTFLPNNVELWSKRVECVV
ncbi:unnamed protein product [Angiostrongylus costaricensis]|uniref:Uncharacterized protein n=1 Tax=Angiostrongylus costaricensis TaxID=334426 RepID=A0A3P7HPI5_ANGCS|nr:unnamed protein product [Angiostrongylus costaricensis]